MQSIQQKAVVIWKRQESPTCFRIGLTCEHGYEEARAGQFVMIHLGDRHGALLRRPFSIFDRIGPLGRTEGIEVLFKVVGKGTARLSRLVEKDTVDLLGPLGRGFQFRSTGPFYLAAGGIGVAPIHFLAKQLHAQGIDTGQCRAFIGGQSLADILAQQTFLDLGMPVTITTDDGSAGDQCLITDPLEEAIIQKIPQAVFACGPPGMLHCVAGIAARHDVPCQVSMETVMACGLGACLGCAVPSSRSNVGYLHTCVNGPVFETTELDWAAMDPSRY
jgi:dihydroorotate dehydrogenase electron transfer subunit